MQRGFTLIEVLVALAIVAIALLAAIYVLVMLATIFLIPELKGKELD